MDGVSLVKELDMRLVAVIYRAGDVPLAPAGLFAIFEGLHLREYALSLATNGGQAAKAAEIVAVGLEGGLQVGADRLGLFLDLALDGGDLAKPFL
jgi:hypothetical protein